MGRQCQKKMTIEEAIQLEQQGSIRIRRTRDFRIDTYDGSGDAKFTPENDSLREQRIRAHIKRIRRNENGQRFQKTALPDKPRRGRAAMGLIREKNYL